MAINRNMKYKTVFTLFKLVQGQVYRTFQLVLNERAMCIKGLIWPPMEPKSESCFSKIPSLVDWFIRRITQV